MRLSAYAVFVVRRLRSFKARLRDWKWRTDWPQLPALLAGLRSGAPVLTAPGPDGDRVRAIATEPWNWPAQWYFLTIRYPSGFELPLDAAANAVIGRADGPLEAALMLAARLGSDAARESLRLARTATAAWIRWEFPPTFPFYGSWPGPASPPIRPWRAR